MPTYVPRGDPELLAKYKMVLIVRRDIEMSKGKIAAQCGHAITMLVSDAENEYMSRLSAMRSATSRDVTYREWLANGMRKVVLKCDSLEQLQTLATAAEKAGLPNVLVEDAGLTEIAAGTFTVLGIGPCTKDEIDQITGGLKIL